MTLKFHRFVTHVPQMDYDWDFVVVVAVHFLRFPMDNGDDELVVPFWQLLSHPNQDLVASWISRGSKRYCCCRYLHERWDSKEGLFVLSDLRIDFESSRWMMSTGKCWNRCCYVELCICRIMIDLWMWEYLGVGSCVMQVRERCDVTQEIYYQMSKMHHYHSLHWILCPHLSRECVRVWLKLVTWKVLRKKWEFFVILQKHFVR